MPYMRQSTFPSRSPDDEESRLVTPAQPRNDSLQPDPIFWSDRIFSLNLLNMDTFTRSKEKALVMFYNSSGCQDPRLESQFRELAENKRDEKYGFGAVDCHLDHAACEREMASETPMLKLYSNGFEVSSIKKPASFDAQQMNQLMTMTPVLTQPRVAIGKRIDVNRVPTPPKKSNKLLKLLGRR